MTMKFRNAMVRLRSPQAYQIALHFCRRQHVPRHNTACTERNEVINENGTQMTQMKQMVRCYSPQAYTDFPLLLSLHLCSFAPLR
jgi:hypothetical protein